MANSKIEWTDVTWNPLAGCTPISPGCTHCYAATMAKRLDAMGHEKYIGTAQRRGNVDVFTGRINLGEGSLDDPMKWKKPRMVFVNSMSDLFHKDVPEEFIASVFATMYEAQWHTFQVLTKRPERLSILSNPRFPWAVGTAAWKALNASAPEKAAIVTVEEIIQDVMDCWPLPNVWLGTSCEDQKRADERIPHLLKCPAAVRFISAEPLLGPIDLTMWCYDNCCSGMREHHDMDGNYLGCEPCPCQGGPVPSPQIDWVICGGESGTGARPMHPDWARSLRDQCQAAKVAFHFKQWGEWLPHAGRSSEPIDFGNCGRHDYPDRFGCFNGDSFELGNAAHQPSVLRVGKKAAGRQLDGRTWDEFPEVQHA